jgi:hypothetical protein
LKLKILHCVQNDKINCKKSGINLVNAAFFVPNCQLNFIENTEYALKTPFFTKKEKLVLSPEVLELMRLDSHHTFDLSKENNNNEDTRSSQSITNRQAAALVPSGIRTMLPDLQITI